MGFGTNTEEVKSHSCHFYQEVHDVQVASLVMGPFLTWLSVCSSLTAKLLIFPSLLYYLETGHDV